VYSLFSTPSRTWGGQITASRFRDVSNRISEDVQKVVDYYRYGAFFSRTDHLLVKLIASMDVPLSYDLERYYDVAIARSLSVANTLRLTSSISKGQWHDGVFYYGCKEIILAYTDTENPFSLNLDWRNLKPVKVLDCPVSNLWYMLPDGKRHNIEEGQATIGIDIPKLMIMFRGFVLHQRILQNTGDHQSLGIRDFVGKYVIPNMLYSQTDLAIHNRLFNLYTGAPMGDSRKHHTFRVSNYNELLDNGLEEILKKIATNKMPYGDILSQIPKVFHEDPLTMPDISETRQVWWALFITRLRAISFLFDVAGEEGRHFNGKLLNELKVDLKGFRSENIFPQVLPAEILTDTQYELKRMGGKL